MQMVNVYLCRSDRDSVLSRGWLDNRLIVTGLAVELGLILLIDYTGVGNAIFGAAPIAASAWLIMIPFALTMLGLEESRKAFVRRLTRESPGTAAA